MYTVVALLYKDIFLVCEIIKKLIGIFRIISHLLLWSFKKFFEPAKPDMIKAFFEKVSWAVKTIIKRSLLTGFN